ncbi:hypothetical protein LCGC14_1150510, partial [marine sediment metagenome]
FVIQTSRVVGDGSDRHYVHASGKHGWGTGSASTDTHLERVGVGQLQANEEFFVAGRLNLANDLDVSERSITLSAGANNDVATGTTTVQRTTSTASSDTITGFAGGRAGRMMILMNGGAQAFILKHLDGGSVAANRIELPGATDLVVSANEGLWMYYDGSLPSWTVVTIV